MSSEAQIKEFRQAFGLPINERPRVLNHSDNSLHLSLIEEELQELKAALIEKELVDIFDALLDLRYVVMGMGVHMGLPMFAGEQIVHASNMSKLDENGEPVYHDGTEGPVGKVKKSDQWWPAEPHLEAAIEEASQ